MKKLLATTALVAMVSGPVLAQTDTTDKVDGQPATTQTDMKDTARDLGATAHRNADMVYGDPAFMSGEKSLRASTLLGKNIYTREGGIPADEADGWSANSTFNDPQDDWDTVGEIEDVLFSQQGQVESVIAGVGGFLGMGETSVRIALSDLSVVPDADSADDYFLVYRGDANVLRDAEVYDQEAVMGEGYRSARAERGLMPTELTNYTVEDLQGTSVYGRNDERVGEIGELIVDEGNKITQAVIDVGGFLGIGEKHIALNFDDIRLMRTENDETPRAYIEMTQDELENLPEYER